MRHTTRFTATAIAVVLSASGVAAAQEIDEGPIEDTPVEAVQEPGDVIVEALEDAGLDPDLVEELEEEIADDVEDLMDAGVIDADDLDGLADDEGRPERIAEHVARQQDRRAERRTAIEDVLVELGLEVDEDANPADIRAALADAGVDRDEIKDLMRPNRPERPEQAQAQTERPERGVDRERPGGDERQRPERGGPDRDAQPDGDEPETDDAADAADSDSAADAAEELD